MQIGARLHLLREEKKLSQADIEARTGLKWSYVSRVENGHSVPSLGSLEKFARALEIPMYHLMYDGDKPPASTAPLKSDGKELLWGDSRLETRRLHRLIRYLAKMTEQDRELVMAMAKLVARRASSRKPKQPNTQ